MDTFKVATFNVKDKGPVGNIITNGIDRPAILAEYILGEKITAIGMQETTKGYVAHLSENLPGKYKFVGDARQLINPLFNESNTIATPYEIICAKTIQLPHRSRGLILSNPIRSLTDVHKRTATYALIYKPGIGQIIIINIHFTYLRENPNHDFKLERFNTGMNVIRSQQFTELLNLQRNLKAIHPKCPIIIMGDFNAPISDELMEQYIIESQKDGIIPVVNLKPTQANNKAPIDHIFYTGDSLELKEQKVSDALSDISDHKVFTATFRRR